MSAPVRLLHVINCLSLGGAQRMLLKLLESVDRSRFEPTVLTLLARDALAPEVEALGVPIRSVALSLKRPHRATRFLGLVRHLRPQVVQGWMYYGDLAALFFRRKRAPTPPVLWNIRHSIHDLSKEKRITTAGVRLGASLSGRADRIVYNSRVTAAQHEDIGYRADATVVIPNGFDLDRFSPSGAAAAALTRAMGKNGRGPVVGMVARFHPMKDHRGFIQAAARLAEVRPDVDFLLAGDDVTWDNSELAAWIREAGLGDRVTLLGPRDDVHEFLPALGVATLGSAWGEGFPNVVGEAMASGVPVVATDVGETREVVGDDEWIVPPGDPEALAAGWKRALELSDSNRKALGQRLRSRVRDRYSLPAVARAYESLYEEALEVSG